MWVFFLLCNKPEELEFYHGYKYWLNKKTSKINIISDVNFVNWQKVFKPEYIKGSSKLYSQ